MGWSKALVLRPMWRVRGEGTAGGGGRCAVLTLRAGRAVELELASGGVRSGQVFAVDPETHSVVLLTHSPPTAELVLGQHIVTARLAEGPPPPPLPGSGCLPGGRLRSRGDDAFAQASVCCWALLRCRAREAGGEAKRRSWRCSRRTEFRWRRGMAVFWLCWVGCCISRRPTAMRSANRATALSLRGSALCSLRQMRVRDGSSHVGGGRRVGRVLVGRGGSRGKHLCWWGAWIDGGRKDGRRGGLPFR